MSTNVLLSQKELKDLKSLCTNLELGASIRPEHLKCLEKNQATRKVTVILKWPNDESGHKAAVRWNQGHEKRIRYGGHLVTASITVLVTVSTANPRVGIAAGTAADVAKDELQAKVWYPKVFRGWTLTRKYDLTYQQFPSKWFEVGWTDIIIDHKGVKQETKTHSKNRLSVGGPNGFPDELARELITMPSTTKTKVMR